MTSPFPGVDPYIEAQGLWPDFHTGLLNACRDAIDDRLPGEYVAHMEEHVHLVLSSDGDSSLIRPDIAILQSWKNPDPPAQQGHVATLEAVTIALETSDLEEIRERWIEIRKLPDLSLVTVIELLSPSNKTGNGRSEYLQRRQSLIDQPVHLVEIDLLLGGRRSPMRRPLPPGHAYAIVSRAERRPDAEVYAWSLRDPLPTIPIPLAAPDPDIPLNLAPAFAMAYRRGRYGRILRYDQPLRADLDAEDVAWIEATARENRV